jgi:hypothetical protein
LFPYAAPNRNGDGYDSSFSERLDHIVFQGAERDIAEDHVRQLNAMSKVLGQKMQYGRSAVAALQGLLALSLVFLFLLVLQFCFYAYHAKFLANA